MMFNRLISIGLLLIVCAAPALGQGRSDSAPGNGPGENSSHQNSNAGGNGNGNAGGNGNGNAGGPGNSGNAGNSNRSGEGGPGSSGAGPMGSGRGPVSLTPDQALEAVQARQAAPLAELAEIVRRRDGGQIVDANLLRVDDILVYAIKVLDQNSQFTVQYYYARSGRFIGSE